MGRRGVLRTIDGDQLGFFCPGCGEAHVVTVAPHPQPWGFNGNYDSPTFTPSILVRGKKRVVVDGRWTGGWEVDAAGNAVDKICHSFVTDGKIQFLGDCTHALAGQTVALQPFGGEGHA